MCGGFSYFGKKETGTANVGECDNMCMPAGGARLDESITGTRHGQKGNTNRGGGCRAWRS